MDKLSEFVDEQMRSGIKPAELRDHLVKNGWNEKDVNIAIGKIHGRKIRSRIIVAVLGIVLIAILALVLVSFAKNANPSPSIQTPVTGSAGGELKNNPVNSCPAVDDSIAKDECYKTLLKAGFDCGTLTDSTEHTYCDRAYEDINIQGVNRIVEG